MLPVDLDTVRLFLHVLAATVWVGRRPPHPAATKRGLAMWGGLSGLSALAALFYGVQLHG